MNTINNNLIVLALGLACSAGAAAQTMTKSDYKDNKDKIAAAYKSSKSNCSAMSGNAKDICIEVAKGQEKVALAELEAGYKPSSKTFYQVQVAKAEAEYEVADERCDDLAGNPKDVCVKQAKSAKIAAISAAKAQMKVTESNATANEKSSTAHDKARVEKSDARKDAAKDTADAQYMVEKEKCDAYAGTVKDNCLNQAKSRFGK